MTDTVRCTLDSARTFTCDVDIGPDPSSPSTSTSPSAPPATASPPPRDPAVLALVTSYQKVTLPTPEVSYFTRSALSNCASSQIGVGLALAAAALGPVAIAGGVKAGFDASKCVVQENNNAVSTAGHAEGAAYCAESGGTVTAVIGDTTYCRVPAGAL